MTAKHRRSPQALRRKGAFLFDCNNHYRTMTERWIDFEELPGRNGLSRKFMFDIERIGIDTSYKITKMPSTPQAECEKYLMHFTEDIAGGSDGRFCTICTFSPETLISL